jgi:hypothetical protein
LAALNSAPKQVPAPLPRYVRPPVRGQEYFSRFSRSKLYQLEREGHIRGISLYAEGGRRSGIKLFDLQSIFDYIENQAQKNSPVEINQRARKKNAKPQIPQNEVHSR